MTPVPLRDAGDPVRFGGKAAGLASCLRQQLQVPEGHALSVDLVQAVVDGSPDARRACTALCMGDWLAVRSSAADEDGSVASFAGQHLTVLGVKTPDALLDAIQRVHASANSPGAHAYRQRLGLPPRPRIGVVIQRLLDPQVSGIMFTVNPVSGADERVIEATWGLGQAAVEGLVTPDHVRLARGGTLVEYRIGHKDIAIRRGETGDTEEYSVSAERIEAQCLGPSQLEALDDLARRAEAAFPSPSDIEFAFTAGGLHLLQRRPVTT